MAANTGIIEGQDMMLFVDVSGTMTAISHATSHTIETGLETRQRNTKDTGKWDAKTPGLLNWTVSSENLAAYDGYSYYDLLALQKARTKITVKLSGRAASGDGTDDWVAEQTGDSYEEGSGYITSISRNDPKNADSTMSITIEGDGELETKTVSA